MIKKILTTFALVLALAVIVVSVYWFANMNKWLKNDYTYQQELSLQLDEIDDLFLAIRTAESGMRGYASTENKKFVTRFTTSTKQIDSALNSLKLFYIKYPGVIDQNLFTSFHRLTTSKRNFMQAVKEQCELGLFENAVATIATETGVKLTDSIVEINNKLKSSIRTNLQFSKEKFAQVSKRNNMLAYTGIGVSFLLIVIVFIALQAQMLRSRIIGEELRVQREHLKITFNSMHDGLITTDNRGKVLFMNPAAERLTGWSNKEASHMGLKSVYRIAEEDSGKPVKNMLGYFLDEKQTTVIENEVLLLTKKNGERNISNTCSPIFDKHGNVTGLVLLFSDITERKRNEERTRRAIERHEILSKATSDCIWDWNIFKDTITYNDGINKIFGYEKNKIGNGSGWWKNNIHADDLETVKQQLRDVFDSKIQTVQLEYRYKTFDNSYKNILDRSFVVYDKQGNASRMIGAMQDVTNEKEQERKLAKTIIQTQDEERQQISMELHDNVNQLLSATLLFLGMVSKAEKEGKPRNDTGIIVSDAMGYIQDAINDIRVMSHRLAPYFREDIPIKEIFESFMVPLRKTGQFEISLQLAEPTNQSIKKEVQLQLYRILQEHFNNIVKHADASIVVVKVSTENNKIKLTVKDNGKGFDLSKVTSGIGLGNIKRRADGFSGSVHFTTAPGHGCEMKLILPLQ